MAAFGSGARNSWHHMRRRCYDTTNKHYPNYGGRGIYIAERWHSFENFLADMGERPSGYSIERIDNNGPYCPENCKWASRKEQQRNRRVNRTVIVEGVAYLAIELAEKAGIKTDTVINRAALGLSMDEILSKTPRRNLSGLALGGAASGAKKRQKLACKRGHEFTDANTYLTPEGWRNCRECHSAKIARRRAAKNMAHQEAIPYKIACPDSTLPEL